MLKTYSSAENSIHAKVSIKRMYRKQNPYRIPDLNIYFLTYFNANRRAGPEAGDWRMPVRFPVSYSFIINYFHL